jgi:phosphoribosyl-dephospho-CoA transferase
LITKMTTLAMVDVTVTVPVGSWGGDCKTSQVYAQAADSAIKKLRRVLSEHGITVSDKTHVKMVTTEEK